MFIDEQSLKATVQIKATRLRHRTGSAAAAFEAPGKTWSAAVNSQEGAAVMGSE